MLKKLQGKKIENSRYPDKEDRNKWKIKLVKKHTYVVMWSSHLVSYHCLKYNVTLWHYILHVTTWISLIVNLKPFGFEFQSFYDIQYIKIMYQKIFNNPVKRYSY